MKKKLLALLMVVVMATLTACGGFSTEDAKDYVQATLDASYKGEFNAFVEVTDATMEESEQMYNENIDNTMAQSGFGDLGLSEELVANYRQLFIDLMKASKYTVGEATETDNGFAVEVTVEPLECFVGLEADLTDVLMDKVMAMDTFPTDEEITVLSFECMYDLMLERLAAPAYGEATSVTVYISENADGEYEISDSDLMTLDSALFSMEM